MSRLDIRSLATFLASSLRPSIDRPDRRVLAGLGSGRLVIDARAGSCTHDDQLVALPAAVEIWRRFADQLDFQVAEPEEFSTTELHLQLRVQRTSDGRQRTCSIELIGIAIVATLEGQIARAEASCLCGYALAPVPTALEQLRAQVLSL